MHQIACAVYLLAAAPPDGASLLRDRISSYDVTYTVVTKIYTVATRRAGQPVPTVLVEPLPAGASPDVAEERYRCRRSGDAVRLEKLSGTGDLLSTLIVNDGIMHVYDPAIKQFSASDKYVSIGASFAWYEEYRTAFDGRLSIGRVFAARQNKKLTVITERDGIIDIEMRPGNGSSAVK